MLLIVIEAVIGGDLTARTLFFWEGEEKGCVLAQAWKYEEKITLASLNVPVSSCM